MLGEKKQPLSRFLSFQDTKLKHWVCRTIWKRVRDKKTDRRTIDSLQPRLQIRLKDIYYVVSILFAQNVNISDTQQSASLKCQASPFYFNQDTMIRVLPQCAIYFSSGLLKTKVRQHLPQYWRSKWEAMKTPAPQSSLGHSRRRRVILPFSSTYWHTKRIRS